MIHSKILQLLPATYKRVDETSVVNFIEISVCIDIQRRKIQRFT